MGQRSSTVMLLLLCLGMLCPGVWGAQERFDVDCFFGWNSYYRPMEWMPVTIGLRSHLESPFAGVLSLTGPQDELNTLQISHPLVATPEVYQTIPLVTKLAFYASEYDLEIRDERGRRQWRQSIPLMDFTAGQLLQPVQVHDLLVGVVGTRGFGLLTLPQETACRAETDRNLPIGKVYVQDKPVHTMPWDWTGFACLDALICYDPDWTAFKPTQLEALGQWVSNGGRLLMVLGSHTWAGDSVLHRQVPVTVQTLRMLELSPTTMSQWGMDVSEAQATPVQSLQVQPTARVLREVCHESETLAVICAVGFGRVGVLGFDPQSWDNTLRAQSANFWIAELQALLTSPPRIHPMTDTPGVQRTIISLTELPDEGRDNHFEVSSTRQATNSVLEHLYDIEQMRPLSIGWVIGLLVLLAILIGPVDYLVLKRLDRQPWTWVTTTFWIALFTVGAYYGVQALRAGDLQIRMVSVVDTVEGQSHGWSTQYVGIFAPKSDDYPLSGLSSSQWWSALAPAQHRLYGGSSAFGRRTLFCGQADGGNLPISVPINIWTLQALQCEAPVAEGPLRAQLTWQGDQVVGQVFNVSDTPVAQGMILLPGKRSLSFERIEARGTLAIEGAVRTQQHWDRRRRPSHRVKLDLNQLFDADGCMSRTRGMLDCQAAGAVVVLAEYAEASTPLQVQAQTAELRHVQVARLVVFPTNEEDKQ